MNVIKKRIEEGQRRIEWWNVGQGFAMGCIEGRVAVEYFSEMQNKVNQQKSKFTWFIFKVIIDISLFALVFLCILLFTLFQHTCLELLFFPLQIYFTFSIFSSPHLSLLSSYHFYNIESTSLSTINISSSLSLSHLFLTALLSDISLSSRHHLLSYYFSISFSFLF